MMPQTFSQTMNMEILLLFTLVLYPAVATRSRLGAGDNVFCAPYPAIVPVDPENHAFFPYFVRLFRCQGSVSHEKPSIKKCVVNHETTVNVSVVSTSLIADNLGMTVKSLKNHTSCGHACVKGPHDCHQTFENFNRKQCVCECKYKHKEYSGCGQGYRWDSHICRCQCDRPPSTCTAKQLWSKEHCSCVALTGHVKNTKENESKSVVYITFLFLEAIVIIILLSVLIHWIRKKRAPEESACADTPKNGFTQPLRDDGSRTRLSYGAD